VIRDITGLHLATLTARHGQLEAASAAAERAFGTKLPSTPRVGEGRGVSFAWSGPGQWLAIAEAGAIGPADDIETRLAPHFEGLASVCEQTDSRLVIEIAGARARDVLAKGLPVDLHPRAFAPGNVALSVVSHVAVQVWQCDDAPTFRLAVARSYADSFRRWLLESAAEYGSGHG
jgi:sarcosine oxidase subunit gamma